MNNFKSNAKGKTLERSKKVYIEFIELLKANDHKLLSEYINNSTNVLIDFNCGHEPHWIRLDHYNNGRRCPKCSNQEKTNKVKENFLNLLEQNNHVLKSEYINTKTKILIDFNCGHKPHWIKPHNYKNGKRCPKCAGKCPEQAKEDLIDLLKENNHILKSEYINSKTKVLIDYNCGHEPNWITPNNYKNGNRCPKCKNKG